MTDTTIAHHGTGHVPLIVVLLPTYNGEPYLPEQIDSVLAQTHQNLLLVCRDDQSRDGSAAVLADYANRYPDKVLMLNDDLGNVGAAANFARLMQWTLTRYGAVDQAQSVYVALADQDDIWHLDKLVSCLQRMRLEEESSTDLPLLVHSDLSVVDSNRKQIAPSFLRYQGLNPARVSLAAQLISNTVTGCTSLMNLSLLRLALPVPDQVVMHDWWLSLVASAFGRLCYVDKVLVEYRQHGSNTIGAHAPVGRGLDQATFARIFVWSPATQQQRLFQSMAAQAAAFDQRFGSRLTGRQRWAIKLVVRLRNASMWHFRVVSRLLRQF